MLTGDALANYLVREFTPAQSALLSELLSNVYANLVKASDFNELKEIVRDLAEAQQRTEQRVGQLAEAQQRTEQRVDRLAEGQERLVQRMEQLTLRVDRLAEGQERLVQRMEQLTLRVDRLAEAQLRTEQRVEQLAEGQERLGQRMEQLTLRVDRLAEAQLRTEEEVRTLARGLSDTRSEVAGLGRQFGYALENEAYRALPALLRDRFNIEITRRFVRTYVDEQEVNLLAEGEQNGEAVLVVGEVKAHLGTDDFEQLERSLEAVRQAQAAGELPGYRIVPVFVAHMARPAALRHAEGEDIIVVQSFEW